MSECNLDDALRFAIEHENADRTRRGLGPVPSLADWVFIETITQSHYVWGVVIGQDEDSGCWRFSFEYEDVPDEHSDCGSHSGSVEFTPLADGDPSLAPLRKMQDDRIARRSYG